MTDFIRASAVCALAAVLMLTVASPASAETTVYHPNANARTFNDGYAGWTGADSAGGPCALVLLCPSVTNSRPAGGGAGGGGYIRSEFGGLLGVAGERSAIWNGPPFVYRGANGRVPDELTFDMDRRADVDALLSVAGNGGTFTAELVDAQTKIAITTVVTAPLEGSPGWSSIPTASVNPSQLEIGKSYFLRITSRIEFGVDVLAGSSADYDNVVLRATIDTTGPSCSGAILGTAGDDRITGTNGGERIKTFKGNDVVFGLRGGDCLYGGPGDDRLSGMIGPDKVNGNVGDDILTGGPGKDEINGGGGKDKVRGGDGNDTLKGGGGDDDIGGAAGRDVVNGAAGNDTLKGGAGPDRIGGGAGADVLRGQAGDDRLRGGKGKDRINGGGGRDIIAGGPGKDRINGGAGNDAIKVAGGGRDRVTCGPGKDRVLADRKDKVARSCEKVRRKGRG